GNAIDPSWTFYRQVGAGEVADTESGVVLRLGLIADDVAGKTLIQFALDGHFIELGMDDLGHMTPDQLLFADSSIAQRCPVREQVAAVAADHHDHLFQVLHYSFELAQPILRPLPLGDVARYGHAIFPVQSHL